MITTGYTDESGRAIGTGDIVECAFYGQGGRWVDVFTVKFGKHEGEDRFYLEDRNGKKHGLDHPKFQSERHIIGHEETVEVFPEEGDS